MTQEINYSPLESLVPFHTGRQFVKALCGPVGSGKSSAVVWEYVMLCLESTVPIRGYVIRENYRALRDTTLPTCKEWLGPISEWRERDETLMVTLPGPDGKSRTHSLSFRACRKPDEASKFLSTEPAFIWLEEPVPAFSADGVMGAGLAKGVFDICLTRLRQKGAPRYELVLSFNPPGPRHWCYETFFKKTSQELDRLGYALFQQPALENSRNLPPGYYERLETILSPDMARRFIRGEVVSVYPGERVFPEAVDGYHIVEDCPPVPGVPFVGGNDWGRTPCVLLSQITPLGQLRVFKEIQLWDASAEKLAEALREELKQHWGGYTLPYIWSDPAGNAKGQANELSCFDVFKSYSFHCKSSAIPINVRLETTKQRLERNVNGEPAVLISRTGCPLLAEGLLGGYRYPKSTDGKISSSPLKNEFSHLADALCSIMTGEFPLRGGAASYTAKPQGLPKFYPLRSIKKHKTRHGWLSK